MGSKFNPRQKVVFGFFVVGFSVVLLRTLQLQIFPGAKLNKLVYRSHSRDISLVGRRGTIRDRTGVELAVSVDSLSVFLDPQILPKRNMSKTLHNLSQVTGLSVAQIKNKISANKNKRFVWLRRQLDSSSVRLWNRLNLSSVPGVGALPEYRRVYPFGALGSQVLGFVSVDGKGLESSERFFDSTLGGERLRVRVPTDAKGRPVFKQEEQVQLREMSGSDLELSLDHQIQFAAEQALAKGLERHKAHSGSVVVMDPKSGEVLAMAMLPGFDPNTFVGSSSQHRKNKIIADSFEPGSVIKPLIVLEGLNKGLFKPKTKVSGGNGRVKIGRKVITEADSTHNFASLTIHDVIKYSSNVGMVSIVQSYGFELVNSALTKLGFGEKTKINLPGESSGLYRQPKPKQFLEKATISYGHGVATTPLQIAVAYSVIANGGYAVSPTITKQSSKTKIKQKRIFSEQAIQQVKQMLSAVVNDKGTGKPAALESIEVAGKTGTAWKVSPQGGYIPGAYIASFVGFFPASSPKYVVAVNIDEPTENGFYGGVVAGPVFKEIAFEIMRNSSRFDAPIINTMVR